NNHAANGMSTELHYDGARPLAGGDPHGSHGPSAPLPTPGAGQAPSPAGAAPAAAPSQPGGVPAAAGSPAGNAPAAAPGPAGSAPASAPSQSDALPTASMIAPLPGSDAPGAPVAPRTSEI